MLKQKLIINIWLLRLVGFLSLFTLGYHKPSLPTLLLWSSKGTKVYCYIIQPSTWRHVNWRTNSKSNKLQISVQKHKFCNYELIFLLFSPPGLKHFWNQIVFRNLFRGLPVDLKTENMQMNLRIVTCGDERFALVGRCCHVTCPLLSYWTHKVKSWLIQNEAVPKGTQLLICKLVFHTSILLINSTEISSLILKIIVRDIKVMCWLHSDVLYIFISGIYCAGNYTPPVRWHPELSRFISLPLIAL
jgi:hypothetical protein